MDLYVPLIDSPWVFVTNDEFAQDQLLHAVMSLDRTSQHCSLLFQCEREGAAISMRAYIGGDLNLVVHWEGVC